MDFLSKNTFIFLTLLVVIISGCNEQDFDDETKKITANVTSVAPNTSALSPNILYSDLYNWNDYKFNFKSFNYDGYSESRVAVFDAQGPNGIGTLEFDVSANPYKTETGYYFFTQIRIDANKLNGNNFEGYSDRNAKAFYLPINEKEAIIYFDETVLTNIRNPSTGPVYLSKNVKGKFIIPINK